jgi:hypothetical protein
MVQNAKHPDSKIEPSIHANIYPLVIRARTFERRVRAANPGLQVFETSMTHLLKVIAPILGVSPQDLEHKYRHFGTGKQIRQQVLGAMVKAGWLVPCSKDVPDLHTVVAESVENFQAFMCSWVSALYVWGQTSQRPKDFVDHEGWVFLPDADHLRGRR